MRPHEFSRTFSLASNLKIPSYRFLSRKASQEAPGPPRNTGLFKAFQGFLNIRRIFKRLFKALKKGCNGLLKRL